ncbi:MAG: stage II sporulation protein R [Thermoleophilia bacterium]|nr:stage II sporulation protein R [Thermoleophilia bacterium]
MKRFGTVAASLIAVTLCSLMLWGYALELRCTEAYNSHSLLRLRVVAASDLPEDQALKLKVRDAVMALLSGPLQNAQDIREASDLVEKWVPRVQEEADRVLAENGASYHARARLCKSFAPARRYGSKYVPPGWYETLEVTLGQGSGENWWCVVFPPLCFVDCTNPDDGSAWQPVAAPAPSLLVEKPAGQGSSATQARAGEEPRVEVKFYAIELLQRARQRIKFMVAYVSGH